MYFFVVSDSTDNLGLFDSSLVLTDISTPSELRSVSTDEPVVKPKTKELKGIFEQQHQKACPLTFAPSHHESIPI